ncbi:hypothetical protein ECC02_010108 [Trypanosoma cruzi]|uniref:Uncharacterized protein n=1 Tax=Trypanosoma cruzi TaxID=5693 RepID=A0A7J6XT60_TRYCR|nr:hypothetical protein ECC02_010108 [Trypanosoma cruzi]
MWKRKGRGGFTRIRVADTFRTRKKTMWEHTRRNQASAVKANQQSKKVRWVHSTTTQAEDKKYQQQKPKRGGVHPAVGTRSNRWDDQRTHSHCSRKAKHTHRERREREVAHSMQRKHKTVTVLRPCSQAGRQRCVWCKREHQRACMGVHAYIQWAHYVCASWGEVRARVHARGHTQRGREGRVCVRAVHGSLSLTLTQPPPQQQHTQQQEEAKEGRWCGTPRCCRHCCQALPYHLFWR